MGLALVLAEDVHVAGLPFFVGEDVPIFFDVGVVEECKYAHVIFAASVDVVVLEGVVDSSVAPAVDVVHGGAGFVENGVHLYSFGVTLSSVVVQSAGA